MGEGARQMKFCERRNSRDKRKSYIKEFPEHCGIFASRKGGGGVAWSALGRANRGVKYMVFQRAHAHQEHMDGTFFFRSRETVEMMIWRLILTHAQCAYTPQTVDDDKCDPFF